MTRAVVDRRVLRSMGVGERAVVLNWLDDLVTHARPDAPTPRADLVALLDELPAVDHDPLAFTAHVLAELAAPRELLPPVADLSPPQTLVIGICDGHAIAPELLAEVLRLDPAEVLDTLAAARAGLHLPPPGQACGEEHPHGIEGCVDCLLEASSRAVAHARLVELGAIPTSPEVEAVMAWASAPDPGDLRARPVLHVVSAPVRRTFTEPEVEAEVLLPWAALRELDMDSAPVGTVTLHLQPIVELDGLTTIGAEALLRWRHPTRGLVPPGSWLPVATAHDAMWRITSWVIGEAADALAGPLEQLPTLSINISPAELGDARLPDLVESALAGRGIAPSRLRIEVAEASLAGEPDDVLASVRALHRLGVGIDVDDFGGSQASLEQLLALHVDGVKLDRQHLPAELDADAPPDATMAVVRLATQLGVTVTAASIETEAQLEALSAIGCERGQGRLLGHPLPMAEFHARLLSGAAAPAGS